MQHTPPPPRPPLLAEVVGWYGMVALLAAYALTSFDVIAKGSPYHLLNLSGGLGVGVICFYRRAWPAFWLEAIWAGVAAVSLVRLLVT